MPPPRHAAAGTRLDAPAQYHAGVGPAGSVAADEVGECAEPEAHSLLCPGYAHVVVRLDECRDAVYIGLIAALVDVLNADVRGIVIAKNLQSSPQATDWDRRPTITTPCQRSN